jgi:uncharacterized protein
MARGTLGPFSYKSKQWRADRGARGRGDATETSDLDLLVDFDGTATFDGYMGLKLFLEDSLGVRVDLVTRGALKPRLRARIEAEARRVA